MGFRRRWPGLSYGRGEDWHYVGAGGEPPFQNSWANGGSGATKMAFRMREAGIVDLAGIIDGAAATDTVIFTLPAAYWPSATTPGFAVVFDDGTPNAIYVKSNGEVKLRNALAATLLFVSGQIFLTPPNVV